MAVPADPAVADVIIQGMQEAGQYTVTSTQAAYLNFKAQQWETIKSELWNACKTDKFLEAEYVNVLYPGTPRLILPSDFDTEIEIRAFDAGDDFRGTAQAGSSTTITLASSFASGEDELIGRSVFTTTGTGAGQVRQIVDFDTATKIATMDAAWTTAPDSTTVYVIAQYSWPLLRRDYYRTDIPTGRPLVYSRQGPFLCYVYPTALDKRYPTLMIYRSNLTRLDESGSTFIKHLRERRHLWIQGVKVRTMAKFDDERYPAEKQIWEQMLAQYAAQNPVYAQLEGHR